MASIGKLSAGRWQARWREPDGRQRRKTFSRKFDAERFLTGVEGDKLRGTYLDPDAGRIRFKAYADDWLAAQTFDPSTRQATEIRLRVHIYPTFGAKELRLIKPSTVQAWLRSLDRLATSYQRVIFTNFSTVLSAAVDDALLVKNPCLAPSVRKPRVEHRKITPWSAEQVTAVTEALPERYAIVATLAAGLGLRQGEVFGLSPDGVDFLRGTVQVDRQVKLFANNRQAFALPKGRKTRTVPLPSTVRDELAAYLAKYPARSVTLPWADVTGPPTTVELVATSRESKAMNRNYFNSHIWRPALIAAGITPARDQGCHALRHWFGSVLIEAGESLKAVSVYLGHSDPSFTARVYIHQLDRTGDRTRGAIDAALGGQSQTSCSLAVTSEGE